MSAKKEKPGMNAPAHHETTDAEKSTPRSAAEHPCLGCGIETDVTRLFCCNACLARWRGMWAFWAAPGDPVCVHLDAQALDALRSFYRGEGADLLAEDEAAALVLDPEPAP